MALAGHGLRRGPQPRAASSEHRDFHARLPARARSMPGFVSFTRRIGLNGTAHACGTLRCRRRCRRFGRRRRRPRARHARALRRGRQHPASIEPGEPLAEHLRVGSAHRRSRRPPVLHGARLACARARGGPCDLSCTTRVRFRGRSALLLLPVALGSRRTSPSVTAVDSIGITVNDMDRAVDFYTRVLTFEKVSRTRSRRRRRTSTCSAYSACACASCA